MLRPFVSLSSRRPRGRARHFTVRRARRTFKRGALQGSATKMKDAPVVLLLSVACVCMLFCAVADRTNETNGGVGFRCPACGKAYTFRSTLLRHYRYECSATPVEPQFACALCPARFRRNERLTHHLQQAHGIVQNLASRRRKKAPAVSSLVNPAVTQQATNNRSLNE